MPTEKKPRILERSLLVPGNIVCMKPQDDVPSHLFEIHEVYEDCIGGLAIDGPYAGAYGQPDIDLISHVEFERLSDTVKNRGLWRRKEDSFNYSYWTETPRGFQLVLDESKDDPMILKDVLIRNNWFGAITGRRDNRTIH